MNGASTRKDAVAIACLIGLGLTTLWNCLKPGYSFALFQDNEYLLGPVFSHMSNAMSRGDWPTWMNTVMGGIPLYNSPQFSPWYPFYFLYLPLYQDALSAIYSLHAVTLGHVFILEVNTYVLLRTLGVSRFGAVLGAALLAFGANTLTYSMWVNITAPYAWLPLYVCALVRLFRPAANMGDIVLGVAAITLLALASPAQALIHASLITVVYVGYQLIVQRRRGRLRSLAPGVVRLCIVATCSVLLAAPVLLPVALDYGQMIRWIGPFPPVIGHARLPIQAFLFDQLGIGDLSGVMFPITRTRAVGHEYVGLFAISLAAFGLLSRRHARIVVPLAVVAVYALLSSAGDNLGLAYVNYALPFLNRIREPSRFLVLFAFAISVLAAIGFDHLRARSAAKDVPLVGRKEWIVAGAIAVLVALFLATSYRRLSSVATALAMVAGWCALLGAGVVCRRGALKYGVALGFGMTAIYFNYLAVDWQPPPLADGHYLTAESLRLHDAMKRVAAIDPRHDYRVIIDGALDKQRVAMIGSFHGVRTFNAYFNPLPYKQFEEIYYHGAGSGNYFRVLGGKYLLCQACSSAAADGYSLRESLNGIEIFETNDVSPYYYLSHRISGIYRDQGDFVRQVAALGLSRGVLLVQDKDHDALAPLVGGTGDSEACVPHEETRTLNSLVVSLDCALPSVFVLNEYFGGQWRARINGTRAPVLRVNGNQVGVALAAGRSLLEITYSPKALELSLYLFTAGLLLFAFLLTLHAIEWSTGRRFDQAFSVLR